MMKFAFALLFLAACAREKVVESPSRPVDETATTTSSTARPLEDPKTPPAPPAVNGPKLAFLDEAAKDPSFVTYRDQLLAAVRARDKKAVLALSDPSIRTSFGGDGGAAELEHVLTEDLFQELEQILALGGTFREGMFWAPYVYSAWPEPHDAFETLAVIAEDVPLRESADAGAPAIATLSRDLVKRGQGAPGPWTKVETADGKTGFVESKLVRSPVDYRAGFIKSDAGWRMNALVAGD
ncbi:MAG TPA: SH3 domain-containing protein [Thermoanaerobaculia bacterium]